MTRRGGNALYRRIAGPLRALAVPALWLAVWQLAAMRMGQALLLPGPLLTARTLASLAGTADFWLSTGVTLARIFCGFLGGAAAGTALAVLTSAFPWANAVLSPAVRVVRATPVVSFILLVLLWLPTGHVPAVIAGLMVLPVLWGNVKRGIAETDPLLLEAARAYRLGRWRTLRLVCVPSALPYFASGCQTALGLAWKAGVAAEVLCMPRRAIGSRIGEARNILETPALFAWTLVIIVLSLLLERVMRLGFDRLGRGRGHG